MSQAKSADTNGSLATVLCLIAQRPKRVARAPRSASQSAVLPNGDAVPCEVSEAQGDVFFCEKHWAVVEPKFYKAAMAAQLVPVPKLDERAN